jgi:antirestriction protein ArdC
MLSGKTHSDMMIHGPFGALAVLPDSGAERATFFYRSPAMKTHERRQEALTRAVTGQTLSNYPAIFQGFVAMGIPESDIRPRENVFTFQAWKALGRHVRKGQHGVKVITFITTESGKNQEPQTENLDCGDSQPKKSSRHSRPWTTTVFHISQTDPDGPRKAA